MANIVDEEKLKETKEFSENYEKLSDRDKAFVLGYMTCLGNSQNSQNENTRNVTA